MPPEETSSSDRGPEEAAATGSADQPESSVDAAGEHPDDVVIGDEAGWGGMPDAPSPVTSEETGIRPESARCAGFCGCFLLLLLIGSSVGGYKYYQYYKEHADPFVNHYRDLGYAIRKGGVEKLDTPLEKDTLVLAQQVVISAPQTVHLTVRANLCEVKSDLKGTLYFKGNRLTIAPGVTVNVLEGDEIGNILNRGTITTNTATSKAISTD